MNQDVHIFKEGDTAILFEVDVRVWIVNECEHWPFDNINEYYGRDNIIFSVWKKIHVEKLATQNPSNKPWSDIYFYYKDQW